jgi:hypothetical protein
MQYYVSFTDWNTRQGGGVSNISYRRARFLANQFINGCEYTFDPKCGIQLNIEYNK